jgi:hypothetical protein
VADLNFPANYPITNSTSSGMYKHQVILSVGFTHGYRNYTPSGFADQFIFPDIN